MTTNKSITISITNAELLSANFSDLLCWWEGFKMGLKLAGIDGAIVADNGIESLQKLNGNLKQEIKRQTP